MRSEPILILAAVVGLAILVLSACSSASELTEPAPPTQRFDVLVFSKTAGFRHSSIEAGIGALQDLGERHQFHVEATEDAAVFTPEALGKFEAVVFLNTTLDILDDQQQAAFEGYIQQGGGFVGVHAAADTEYDWPWYGELVGAYFQSHPDRQEATVLVTDRNHPSTVHLPVQWERYDEWYNYNMNPRPNVHVLATVQEGSYEGGEMGHDHPIAWAHHFDGGRAWYTGLGHTEASYADALFLQHLLGGIEWAAGQVEGDVGATLASSFDKVVLSGALTDPMELDITTDGRVFVIEWAGAVKVWEPDTGELRVAGWIPVDKIIEDGLLGLALDPNFDENGWMYIYYSSLEGSFNRLSRFTYDGTMVDMDTEIAMLDIPVQRNNCCHSGGAVQFDDWGNLYVSTGDNSGGDRDHVDLAVRRRADQGRTAGNTNDLRGKILRITPQADGTYTIPEGNLFPTDSLHRPEIYTMGHRNPFRYSLAPETGWVCWGDVGPNANGYEEFNCADTPGFFGWPLFTGYNVPFPDYYFFGTEDMSLYTDPKRPINGSSFNTGARELPPAQPAKIAYQYGTSPEYPSLGAGGVNPMGGPIFLYDAATASPNAFPAYYDGKWMIYEWMRHWIQVVTFDDAGNVLAVDPFLPGMTFVRPMDIEVGPDGRLYILEWGDEFWGSNPNAQLVRLDYYGSPDRSEPMATEAPTEGPLAIAWPPDGGIFDVDATAAYDVELHDQAVADQVKVNVFTGFDTSAYPLESKTGLAGTFRITDAYTHSPPVHYVNRFAELEACLQVGGARSSCDRIRLQPRRKEAEHIEPQQSDGYRRLTYSARPASLHWAGTNLTVIQVSDSSHLAYTPVNLANIDALTLRFKPHAAGSIDLRLDAPDGQRLATVATDSTIGTTVVPEQMDYIKNVPDQESGMRLLNMEGLYGWREVQIPITDPGGTHTLYLVFSSEAEGTMLELDWMRFEGEGVHVQRSRFNVQR